VHLSRLAMAPGQKLSGGELANCNVTEKYTFVKELRLRQTLGSNKISASVGFHLTFAVMEIGFFSAGCVPVGTSDRKSGPMISTQ
jgi:hypothetical protein